MTMNIYASRWINKYTMLAVLYTFFILILFGAVSASAMPSNIDDTVNEGAHNDIVDVAVNAGSFTTLVAAVKAAGLVETLKGDGPFTVFAPTDDAFGMLPARTIKDLLKPENRDQLTAILTYHVVPGEVRASDLLNVAKAKTVNGKSLPIGLRVGEANVIQADIEASNGIIHVIDTVLMPAMDTVSSNAEMARDLIETAINRGAPLYNRGQIAACAAIYEVTAKALLSFDAELPPSAQRPLRRALQQMARTHDMDRRAWIMREGLDEAYAALSSSRRMMSTASARH